MPDRAKLHFHVHRQWIWNGSSSLVTLKMNATWNGTLGANQGYSADGLGSIDPLTQTLTLTDNDFDGAVAQYHNSTGHSAWNASNPYNQFCISANGIPASSGYNGPGNAPVPSDGSSDPSLSVTSTGRAYLSRSMGFTTPDYSSVTPYAGGQRTMSDYCKNGTLVHTLDGPHNIIGCGVANPYIPPPCEASNQAPCGHLQGPDDPFGVRDPRRPGAVLLPRPPQTTKSCNGSPQGFALPPNAPEIPLAFDAGRVHGGGKAAVGANVGSGGMFDYQRYGLTGPNSGSNSAWVPASNFVVGVYMNGAGVPVPAMDVQGSIYSR